MKTKPTHQCPCSMTNKLTRNYTNAQYNQFETIFKRKYPLIYKEIIQSCSCKSGIIYELYASNFFYEVMK
jgi:hypothetical protein